MVFQYVNFSATPGDLDGALAAAPGLSSQRTVQVGAWYDWRVVKLFAQYMNVANRAQLGNFHGDTLQAGVSVPIGVGSLLASYAYTHSSGALADGAHRSTGALGYDYLLSKRTDLYSAIKVDHVGGLSTGITADAGLRTRF